MGSLFGPKKYSNSADDSPEPAKNYAANPTGELFGDKLYIGIDETTAVVGDTYSLVEEDGIIYLRRGSDGTLVEPGVPAGSAAGAAFQIGFLPPGHDDHSGGENDGEIILGDSSGNIISALPVDVRANGTVVDGDNGLIGIDNGRIVFNVSTVVQAGDERPVNSAAVQTALDNLPAGHSDIGGILSISSTPDKVAEIGIYDTDSARIGQQFVISTVDTVQDTQDININSEPSAGTSTTQLAQRLELSLNKATAATAGDNRPITSSAVHSAIAGVGGSDVAPFQAGVPYAAGENFTNLNKLYAVNGATEGFANIAAAISNSTLLVDGDVGSGGDAVLYTTQTLTEAQKEIARNNIDAAGHLELDSNLSLELADGLTIAGNIQVSTIVANFGSYDLLVTETVPGALVGDYFVYIQDGQTDYSIFQVTLAVTGATAFLWVTSGSGSRPTAGAFSAVMDHYRPASNFAAVQVTGFNANGDVVTDVATQLQFNGDELTVGEAVAGSGVFTVGVKNTTFNVAEFSASEIYIVGQNFTSGNKLYEVTTAPTADDRTFDDAAQAIASSTEILDGGAGGDATNAVLYTEQTLTTPQQTQARTNIGAQVAGNYLTAIPDDVIRDGDFTVTGGEAVSVNIDGTAVPFPSGGDTPATAVLYTEQTLTNAQQIQARANIAASRQTELWATGQNYVVGDNVLVVFSGDIIGFACLADHTSDNTPGGTGNGQPRINVDNSNWQQIGFQNIIPWVTGFAWQTGDVVLYRDLTPNNLSNSGLYIRRVGGVDADSSQNPFVNTADWLPLGGSGGGIEVLSSDPSSPTDGQVWYNSSQELIKYFDGELTLDIAKFLGYFSTDPTHSSANHSDGDMWYNTTENEFKYFSGSGVVHTIITNLDSITALSDGQAVLDSIATETSNREAADTTLQNNIDAEAVARESGDAAERDFVETTLHVDPADSQSYYQFSGVPAIFAEDPAIDYGITVAMPQTIEDTEALVQAETIGETTKVFKLTLRYGDGANDTKQYVVTTGGYNFTISDERTSETFRLPSIEGTYVAASVHINGTSTRRQDCFLAIGGWYGRIAQVDMAHVLNVSNGDILAGRSLEVGQDYSEHTIADNNNTAVVGLVFDNQTTGSHTGINAYALQRRNRIVRYRAATSGGLFSFRNGNSVVDRFNPSRVPDVVSQQTVDESNWLGLKLVTIQNAISGTSAGGDTNRLTFAVSDKMLTAFGEATDSASAGISIPGIAVCKNPSTFDGGSVNLGLFYPGGNDPSEEYSDYSSATEANFNAHIFDMEYSNASGAWTFFFGGQTVGETAIATSAAGFHGTSIWNMASISTATKAGAGGIIRSVNLGGNIAGLASDTNFWVTTELGALWVSKTPWLAAGYGSDALVQAHTNPNDPTSDIKRDFTFRGFQYFDQHGSIGAGDDGHIYRLVINPEVTFTVTFGNVTHTARYRFNDDTADMHAFFGNPASYSPTLAGTGVSLTTAAPGGEPNDQLYLDYAVNGQNTPVVSYQWVGVLSTTDDDFETYSPFRRIDLANTVVDIHYPDGGATYHIPMSSNINDYTVGGEANGAVDQMVAAVNTHTAQGHSAVRVDAGFADTITNTKPVLRLDQTGTHALQNAPTITIAHPSGQNTGTLAVESFADGGYDTIGRPGGLFDPNNYDTRAETDAKIAAIASTHGYAENIVPNAGTSGVTYPRYSTLQVGTEIGRMDYTGEEMVTAINAQSEEIVAARIGTGIINNSEFNTLNGINTNETIQTQLNAKQATVSVTGSVGDNIIGFTADSSGNLLTLARGTTTAVDTTLRVDPDSAITPDGDVAWDLYVGENLGYTKTSVTYQPNLVASDSETWNPLLISASGTTGNFVISNVPFTLDVNSRYVAEITTPSGYNGTVEFNGTDVTVGGGSGFGTTFTFDVLDADTSFSPALTPTDFVSASGNTISMRAVTGGTETNIVGNVIITGPGVVYNTTTGALTISGGGVTDAFRYSQLLTGGFLVQRSAAMDTATRRAYTDTQGAYGTANTTYYYEATSKSWFNVASGGTALISFPST